MNSSTGRRLRLHAGDEVSLRSLPGPAAEQLLRGRTNQPCVCGRSQKHSQRMTSEMLGQSSRAGRTSKRSGPSRFSSTKMTEPLVAAEQTATFSPASRASSYSRITPGRGSTDPLPAGSILTTSSPQPQGGRPAAEPLHLSAGRRAQEPGSRRSGASTRVGGKRHGPGSRVRRQGGRRAGASPTSSW